MNTGRSGSGTYFSSLSLSRHTTHMLWHIAPFLALLTATEPPPPRQGKVVYGECPRHIFPSSSSSPPRRKSTPPPPLPLCRPRPQAKKGERRKRCSNRRMERSVREGKTTRKERGEGLAERERAGRVNMGRKKRDFTLFRPPSSPLSDSKPLFPFRQMAAMEEEERGKGGSVNPPLPSPLLPSCPFSFF